MSKINFKNKKYYSDVFSSKNTLKNNLSCNLKYALRIKSIFIYYFINSHMPWVWWLSQIRVRVGNN